MKRAGEKDELWKESCLRRRDRERREADAVELAKRDETLSLESIARRVGLSRSAVHRILRRAGVQKARAPFSYDPPP